VLLLVVWIIDADTDASTARWKRGFLGVLAELLHVGCQVIEVVEAPPLSYVLGVSSGGP
jgi:hypothetical protein